MDKRKRVLLKISGEALAGEGEILSHGTLTSFAKAIKQVNEMGVELAIVVGAGNIWRGKYAADVGLERCNADYMGMLATVINALALQDVLEANGLVTRVQSAIEIKDVCEPYIRRRALRHLEKGRILIFSGGTGNPFFSTDTTAALRAAEINADVILMAKNGVDGVYDSDPKTNANAKLVTDITYMELISKQLQVMDNTAVTLCMNNNIELVVFNMKDVNNIIRVINGENVGTRIRK
jgi:uridylate kinase